MERVRNLRDRLEEKLLLAVKGVKRNGRNFSITMGKSTRLKLLDSR
jgi:hypothetical protein